MHVGVSTGEREYALCVCVCVHTLCMQTPRSCCIPKASNTVDVCTV